MARRITTVLAALGFVFVAGTAYADSIHGQCIGKGGAKCQNHHRISTSWNGRTAHIDASRGTYELDFGGPVDQTVTVYCDGRSVGRVHVKGSTNFTVRCD